MKKKRRGNIEILDWLLASIRAREGEEGVEIVKDSFKEEIKGALGRELIVQIISRERLWVRTKFLILYPGYLLPYLFRIRA